MRIDSHTHILPQMDDGSRSPEESLAMLREERTQGVDLVVLTPHFYAAENDVAYFLKRRAASWDRLRNILTPDLPQIRLGAEVQYFEGIGQEEDLDALEIEGSRILLLEMPFSKWSKGMVRDILSLHGNRRQILLAHVERYLPFQTTDVWNLLLENGILMQCNASFFRNWRTRRRAISLLRGGRIHMVASDCHDLEKRPPDLERAYQIIGSDVKFLRNEL